MSRRALTPATCAGAGVPTAVETRVQQLDLLPL